jgi:hypothetical protein
LGRSDPTHAEENALTHQEPLARARSRLITVTCLGVVAATIFMLGFWVLSGSLEDWETIVAGAVLSLILAGVAALARRGRVTLAAWLLTSLLTLIITENTIEYSVGSPSAAFYVVPIVLAAFTLGFWVALGIAGLGSVTSWVMAWGTTSGGWTTPPAPIDHLTFNAPAITILLFVVALIAGYWVKLTMDASR